MNKKALGVAVVAALAASSAWAQSGGKDDKDTVTIYGKIYPEILTVKGSGATPAGTAVASFAATPTGTNSVISHNEIESSNSRLGFRGQEKLGGGLTAIFQLETVFSVDSASTTFATRDSFVGVKGGWGTIKLGRMDTPFKTYGDDISFLGVSSGNFTSTSEVLRKSTFGTSSSSSFHLRRPNVVNYDSPEFGGFEFTVMYSPDEAKTATRQADVYSAGFKYEKGPLYLAVAFETHDDLFGGSRNARSSQSNFADQTVNSEDKAVQYTAKYTVGRHTFEVDFIEKKYDENATTAGRFKSYKNKAYLLAMDNRWNRQWRTAAHYVKSDAGSCTIVGAACSTEGLESQQISVGVSYSFTRRTYLFAMYSELKNGKSARANPTFNSSVSVGEDVQHFAVGVQHAF